MVTLARSISYLTRINIGGGLVMHFMQTENDLRVNVYVYTLGQPGESELCPIEYCLCGKSPQLSFGIITNFLSALGRTVSCVLLDMD